MHTFMLQLTGLMVRGPGLMLAPQAWKVTCSIYSLCLLPTRPHMYIPYPTWLWPSLAGHTASMCMYADSLPHRPFLCFHGQERGKKEGMLSAIWGCWGFNQGRQGQQTERGGAEEDCLSQRQRARIESQQQQEEEQEKLEGEPSILINHARSGREMQRLDLQELSQAINFH